MVICLSLKVSATCHTASAPAPTWSLQPGAWSLSLTQSSEDSAFRTLADPTRRQILRLLGQGKLTAGEIGNRFAISQPAVSRHLGMLRNAGLITAQRVGQTIVYQLDTTVFQDVVRMLLDLVPAPKPKPARRVRKLART